MATISPDLSGIVDGQVADAADFTSPFNTITNAINGSLDADNLADNAVTTAKITNSNITAAKLDDNLLAGWILLTASGTRVGDTSFTVAGDVTDQIAVGDKLKLTDTTTKYYYVTAVAYTSSTLITVTGGTDYTVVGDPSNIYYSKVASPVGFPQCFNYTPTFTGFSADPSAYISQFTITDRIVTWFFHTDTGGTSNATTYTMTIPVTAKTLTNGVWYFPARTVDNSNNVATPGIGYIASGGTTVALFPDYAYTNWTNSGGKRAKFTAIYPI